MTERSKYEFVKLSDKIAEALLQAAEDQVTEAQNLLASTKILAEQIGVQVEEQSKLLEDMHDRLKTFGGTVIDAHRKFLNGEKGNGNGK
jgi:multidrug efflux pump subunit AcrA (membrane-fusion protein)